MYKGKTMTILGSHQIIVIIQHTIQYIIVHLIDIQMFYIKYLTMHKVQMHAGAIRKLLYGVYVCIGR